MSIDIPSMLDELQRARTGSDAMQAATMTLVVYFDDERIASWVRERMRAIAAKHPCRVIVTDATRGASAHRVESSSAHGDWIEFGVEGSAPESVASSVGALAVAEAPLILVWAAQQLASHDLLVALARRAQTIVCNTSLATADDRGLRELIEIVDRHPELNVADLAYLRLSAWQEAVAEFFDERDHLEELYGLRNVEIVAGSQSEMYYLIGWLASRLAWRPCGSGEFCNRAGETIAFTLRTEGAPRRIARIALKSNRSLFSADVHAEDPNAVCLSIAGRYARDTRCGPLHSMDIAGQIERAILDPTRDAIFIESLAMVKAILAQQ